MAATTTVPEAQSIRKPDSAAPHVAPVNSAPRCGVVSLFGYGINVRIDKPTQSACDDPWCVSWEPHHVFMIWPWAAQRIPAKEACKGILSADPRSHFASLSPMTRTAPVAIQRLFTRRTRNTGLAQGVSTLPRLPTNSASPCRLNGTVAVSRTA